MRLSPGRTHLTPPSTVESAIPYMTVTRLPASGPEKVLRPLLSARRPQADPLTLHLIEMNPRIVLGDRKS